MVWMQHWESPPPSAPPPPSSHRRGRLISPSPVKKIYSNSNPEADGYSVSMAKNVGSKRNNRLVSTVASLTPNPLTEAFLSQWHRHHVEGARGSRDKVLTSKAVHRYLTLPPFPCKTVLKTNIQRNALSSSVEWSQLQQLINTRTSIRVCFKVKR